MQIRGGEKLNKIRSLRATKRLTQRKVADRLGLNVSSVTKWETGKSNPRADKLPLLAETLDCTIDELFDGKDDC